MPDILLADGRWDAQALVLLVVPENRLCGACGSYRNMHSSTEERPDGTYALGSVSVR